MRVILTHNQADFDALASLLGAHKLYPDAVPVLPARLNRNVREFVSLYQNGLPMRHLDDIALKAVDEVILVDTQRLPDVKGLRRSVPLRIIDHHPLLKRYPADAPHLIHPCGATVTLIVEQMQARGLTLETLEATLLALGVYEDTGALTYGTTTPRDTRAVAWLQEQKAVLDTVRRFLTPPLSSEQLAIYDYLLTHSETRTINGYPITIGHVTLDHTVNEINGVAHRLRDTLDPTALFVVAELPRYVQLIARGTEDTLDVGEIARSFGGGGHARAAAASIETLSGQEVVNRLWELLPARIRPPVTVGDLMSRGVRTVRADAPVGKLIGELRRVGHEGYPVIDGGQVVGLLTRRDADRAVEHGLGAARVREVMSAGTHTLTPQDSVSALEQLIVNSGWGQIPIVDADGHLIGIVTRTDLIKHWAQTHPAVSVKAPHVDPAQIEAVLGHDVATLIHAIGRFAQDHSVNLYMVGGVVRDLLLSRPNDDIDFVVEAGSKLTAIALAHALQAHYGGHVSSYEPFGTAKWRLTDDVAAGLGIVPESLPHHIDFAMSRNEFYEHPTALPTVYVGSIKLDLLRRDFTINTLAVQISPSYAVGRVLDFYGGVSDLERKLVRVLHSLSFVDDPTRILRAVRFVHRLGFAFEPRTAELIETARPMLRRITGERVRNEITLLLKEARPESALLDLQMRGCLTAIHPAFTLHADFSRQMAQARALGGQWLGQAFDLVEAYWHIVLAGVPAHEVQDVCERLLMNQTDARSISALATLLAHPHALANPDAKPSQIVARLEGLTLTALLAAWLVLDDARIVQYVSVWRQVRPLTSGHDLNARGLTPGPAYKRILDRLRAAWLDGEISDAAGEHALLEALLAAENAQS